MLLKKGIFELTFSGLPPSSIFFQWGYDVSETACLIIHVHVKTNVSFF